MLVCTVPQAHFIAIQSLYVVVAVFAAVLLTSCAGRLKGAKMILCKSTLAQCAAKAILLTLATQTLDDETQRISPSSSS